MKMTENVCKICGRHAAYIHYNVRSYFNVRACEGRILKNTQKFETNWKHAIFTLLFSSVNAPTNFIFFRFFEYNHQLNLLSKTRPGEIKIIQKTKLLIRRFAYPLDYLTSHVPFLGCKQFFRRSVIHKREYICPAEGNCQIRAGKFFLLKFFVKFCVWGSCTSRKILVREKIQSTFIHITGWLKIKAFL
jgi:hypothetical protein